GCARGRCEGGTCSAVAEGSLCASPDPAIFGSCEYTGCSPDLGVCPSNAGEGAPCDGMAIQCTPGEGLSCSAGGTCERTFPLCE
ncbi:MAG: hypothetical protein DRJ42_30095, partial [Deltaproteobacteria bacterium]